MEVLSFGAWLRAMVPKKKWSRRGGSWAPSESDKQGGNWKQRANPSSEGWWRSPLIRGSGTAHAVLKGQSSGGTGLGRVGLSISEKGTNPNLISRVSNEENVGSKAKGGGRWKQRARAVVSQETTTDGRIRIGNQWDVVVQAESLIRNQSDEDGVGVVDRHERVMMPSVLGKHVGIDADGLNRPTERKENTSGEYSGIGKFLDRQCLIELVGN
ncbi:hypothetical protein QYF36_010815 [Acer negundo]|nr:hypothetical protein QYF36_010815 [Acer negundo]